VNEAYSVAFDPALTPSPASVGLIWAEGIAPPVPPTETPAFLAPLCDAARDAGAAYVPDDVRARVRRMLRFGKYKPSGRGKPASEFLLRAAVAAEFPLVSGPVDVNNAISLESGLPGSLFDTALSGRRLLVRRGGPGESYVFNRSGQSIDLEDLLLVCRQTPDGWEPCGNPVKDSMATKIRAETRDVVAVLYAPADEPVDRIEAWASRYAELLGTHCCAERTGFRIVTQSEPPADREAAH